MGGLVPVIETAFAQLVEERPECKDPNVTIIRTLILGASTLESRHFRCRITLTDTDSVASRSANPPRLSTCV
jgi:hypothetical protein